MLLCSSWLSALEQDGFSFKHVSNAKNSQGVHRLQTVCGGVCVHKTSSAFLWDNLISLLLGFWTCEPEEQHTQTHTSFHMYKQTKRDAVVKQHGAGHQCPWWWQRFLMLDVSVFFSTHCKAPPADWQLGYLLYPLNHHMNKESLTSLTRIPVVLQGHPGLHRM